MTLWSVLALSTTARQRIGDAERFAEADRYGVSKNRRKAWRFLTPVPMRLPSVLVTDRPCRDSLSLCWPGYHVRARVKPDQQRATRRSRPIASPHPASSLKKHMTEILGRTANRAPPFRDSVPLKAVFWAENALRRYRVALSGSHLDSVRGPAQRREHPNRIAASWRRLPLRLRRR